MIGILGIGTTHSKPTCAGEEHRRLSYEHSSIIRSFGPIRLFPMDYRFLLIFSEKHGERTEKAKKRTPYHAPNAFEIQALKSRRTGWRITWAMKKANESCSVPQSC